MFGLTRREQRWKADQQAAEVMLPVVAAALRAAADVRIAEANVDATELAMLKAENAELRALLARYRADVPLGNQPHMLAHKVDEALKA